MWINVEGIFCNCFKLHSILFVLVFRSCAEAYKKSCNAKSGVYYLRNNLGEPFPVYCEFKDDYGYMFLSKNAFQNKNIISLKYFDVDRTTILLRFKDDSDKQKDSTISQLPAFLNVQLTFLITEHNGYNPPYNTHLGPYLYIGVIPKIGVHSDTTHGYVANGKEYTFTNDVQQSNSYFAFYPNLKDLKSAPVSPCCPLLGAWMKESKDASKKLPEEFFFLHEEHFGEEEGARGVSPQLSIKGVAPGFKFYFS